jgi:hypothetical protein
MHKDVERAFGVLQARFAMVHRPARWWYRDQMVLFWKCAVILHNMIIEDEATNVTLNQDYLFQPEFVQTRPRVPFTFTRLGQHVKVIQNKESHCQLENDIVEHLWAMRGDESDLCSSVNLKI